MPDRIMVDPVSVLDPGWRPLWELDPPTRSRSSFKFSTFLRPLDSGSPHEFPQQWARLPLMQMSSKGLVFLASASPSEIAEIRHWKTSSLDISTDNIKTKGSPAQLARGKLCIWIHESGSRILRALNAGERDRALGFPDGASLAPLQRVDIGGLEFDRLAATGNSFCPRLIAHVLRPWADSPSSGVLLFPLAGSPRCRTKEEAMVTLTPPSGSVPGNGRL